jgi:hypothetical protein
MASGLRLGSAYFSFASLGPLLGSVRNEYSNYSNRRHKNKESSQQRKTLFLVRRVSMHWTKPARRRAAVHSLYVPE